MGKKFKRLCFSIVVLYIIRIHGQGEMENGVVIGKAE